MKLNIYSASWCSPCKQLSRNLLQVDFDACNITLVEHDVDLMTRPELARLGVRSVPTLILMDSNGVELSRKTGALTAEDIKNWLGV